MAHKKGAGSSDNGRDSKPKYLGVKLFGGQVATAGNIIIRQRGTKFHPGDNAYMGKDFTIHAKVDGTVVFRRRKDDRTYVSIRPSDELIAAMTRPILGTRDAALAAQGQLTTPVAAPAKAARAPKAAPAPVAKAAPAEALKGAPAPAASVEPVSEPNDPEFDAPVAAPVEVSAPLAAATHVEPVAEPAPVEPVAAPAPKSTASESQRDDLKLIEGIGPKIEMMLNEGGFLTFASLAEAPVERVQAILDAGGPRYRIHNPATWAKQAALAAAGKMDELKALQDNLNGGKDGGAE